MPNQPPHKANPKAAPAADTTKPVAAVNGSTGAKISSVGTHALPSGGSTVISR